MNYSFFWLILLANIMSCFGRSIHRPVNHDMPYIVTSWEGSAITYQLQDWHLEMSALFKTYDKDFFNKHMLPLDLISYRNRPGKNVTGMVLDNLLNNFIDELYIQLKKGGSFSDFIVIKDRDYNYKAHAGTLVIKFKNYPFVVKLFIENPQSFVKPYSKGFEPSILFIMGGGINRYLSGFTRIKNLHAIEEHINSDDHWKNHIDIPRKWFWLPKENRLFRVEGFNIGWPGKHHIIVFPAIYGIICDEIESDAPFKLLNAENRKLGMELSQFLGNRVDPHIYNFMLERISHKIVLVDTEHFPSMIGLREPVHYQSYLDWYNIMISKCLCDSFLRTKKDQRAIQRGDHGLIMTP